MGAIVYKNSIKESEKPWELDVLSSLTLDALLDVEKKWYLEI